MSFDVFLIASSASPGEAQFDRDVREVISASGARFGADGVTVTTAAGDSFELFGSMFALRDLTPSSCELIFKAAVRTNAYVTAPGDEPVAYEPDGLKGEPPADFLPVRLVADPHTLCASLAGGFQAWRDFSSRDR